MMFIYACTIILTAICEVIAVDQKDFAPNVGTVLFTAADLKKKQWSKSELALLKARRYFQTLLPPPVFINNFNEDYVNILLGYFRDAYTAIRREAPDTGTDTIMTTALSDAIGGYLKVWVLPVAKLDYYGGTVSQNNVVKLFQFYNEIKRYLDTDGVEWREPDEKVLNSMTINVAPLKIVSNTRSMKDPCDNLAYFEKTDSGLAIPIPNVNWNQRSSTMFIPLKNTSLIRMNTPDSSHNLIKYYDAATNCIQSSNPKEQEKFDEKFQDWLANDVVPHLKDENLYLALGSVLSLVNRTRDLCNNVIDLYGNRFTVCGKPPSHALVDLSCKKMWVISIILLIEVAWCIPALIYILCSKRFQKKDCTSNVYLFIDNNKGEKAEKKGKGYFKGKASYRVEDTCTMPQDKSYTTSSKNPEVKLLRRSEFTNMEFEGELPETRIAKNVGIGSKVCCVPSCPVANKTVGIGSKVCCVPSCPVANKTSRENPKQVGVVIKKKSSLKKPVQNLYPDRCNSMQLMALSSHDQGFSCSSKLTQSNTSFSTVRNASKNVPVDSTLFDHKNRKRQGKCDYTKCDDRRKSEECCQVLNQVRSNRSPDGQGRFEALRKAEECKKLEERRRAEEYKKAEERRRVEEYKKLEERKKAEEYKKQEERRRSEELRKQEERRRAEEGKKVEDRKNAEEYNKLEEWRKAEERKKLEDNKKTEDSKKIEERRKAEERKIMEERKIAEERKKAEEYQKSEERRMAEEHRIAEERRLAEELRIAEEFRMAEEHRMAEERKMAEERRIAEELRIAEECRMAEELRNAEERNKTEEFQKLEECITTEKCQQLNELKKNEDCRHADVSRMFEDHRRAEECRLIEKQDNYKTLDEYRMLEKLEECRTLEEQIKAEEFNRRRKLLDDQKRKYEEYRKFQERMELEQFEKLKEQNDEQKRLEEFRRRRKSDHSRRIEERRKPDEAKTFDEYKELEEIRQLDECRKHDDSIKYDKLRKYDEARKFDEPIKYNEIINYDEARNNDKARKYDESRNNDKARKYDEARNYDDRRKRDTARNLTDRKKYEEIRKFEESDKYGKPREHNKGRELEEIKNLDDYREFDTCRQLDAHRHNNKDFDDSKAFESLTNLYSGTKIYNDFRKTEDLREQDRKSYNKIDNCGVRGAYSNKIDDLGAKEGGYSSNTSDHMPRDGGCKNTDYRGSRNKIDDRVARDGSSDNKTGERELRGTPRGCHKGDDREGRDCSCDNKTGRREVRGTPRCCHKADDRVARDRSCIRSDRRRQDETERGYCKRTGDRRKREHSCSRRAHHRKERDDNIYIIENRNKREDSSYLRTKEKKDSEVKENTDLVNDVKFENLDRKAPEYDDHNSQLADSRDTVTDELQKSSCPCTECIDSQSTSTCRDVTSDSLSKYQSEKPMEKEKKTTRFQVTKERIPGNRGGSKNKVKVKAGKSPYLEITIDRPTTEICVDMGQCKSHYSSFKPSKIPKRAGNGQPCHSRQGSDPSEKQSLIPQPNKKTLDDIALAQCGCSRSCASRLNDTF
ncbi:trichohyalin-like [Spodoptera litura]|uniref:Trichohyalin-like n=1 Tax=Spodoptera litura TaxID=69820 RepID=A0A9J7EC31_SPOLT|nr:trichohyalin-like [Spodoptera litura]